MTSTNWVHTADNQMPPLGDDLERLFEELAAIQDPAADQILSGLRLFALTRYSVDQTQTRVAWLAGGSDGLNLINLIGEVIARLATPDTNPALRALPEPQQKLAQLHGETTAFALTNSRIHQFAANTAAAIDGI